MSQRNSIKSYLLSIAAVLSFAAFAEAQTYSGQAFTGSVKVSLVGQPVVTTNALDTGDLPPAGGDIEQEATGVYLLPGGVLTLGTRSSSTSGLTSAVPAGQSLSAASVQSVDLGALGFANLVTAGVVTANTSATCSGPVLVANSGVANLNVS